jgi:YbbR domain-containing protein
VRFLRKYVFANGLLKLMALGISLLLWATYTSAPYAEVIFQVPVEFTNMPSQLEISGDVPTSVHVRVRGRSALLRRMTRSDVNLRIDFNHEKEGAATVRILPGMVGVPYGATVVQVSPSEFHVTLVARRGSSSVPSS